jgi:AcrR family transcriptional regulator
MEEPVSTAGNGAPSAAPDPRERILEAAARAVAGRGYHGMSMRELARGAGMSLSNLYNYFASKEEILYALQKEAFEVLVGSAEAALAGLDGQIGGAGAASADARLYVFVSHHVRYVAERSEVMRVLVHEAASLPAGRRGEVRRLKERYFRIARDIIARLVADGCGGGGAGPACAAVGAAADGRDDGELDRLTYNLFGMLNWIYGWYDPQVHGEPRQLAHTIHRIALCGMVAQCPYRELQESLDFRLASVAAPPLLGPPPPPKRPESSP